MSEVRVTLCILYKLLVKSRVISRPFTPAEAEESSTFRELTAVRSFWLSMRVKLLDNKVEGGLRPQRQT